MPPPTTGGGGINVYGSSIRPLTPISRNVTTLYFAADFNVETCHTYASCEWATLKRFSRWKDKRQDLTYGIMAEAYILTV